MPTRLRSAALALGVGSAVLGAPPAASAACGGGANGEVVRRPDGWTELRPPAFADGAGRRLADYALSPYRPDLVYATNGRTVLVTRDGGCVWRAVFRDEPPQLGVGQIGHAGHVAVLDVAVPAGQPREDVAWLLLDDRSTPVARPDVARSGDGGATWQRGGAGLPATGSARLLAAAPGGRTAYVTVDAPDDPLLTQVFATTDAGRSWEPRGRPFAGVEAAYDDPGVPGGPRGMLVDPADARELWVWETRGLFHSTDGAETFRRVDEVIRPLSAFAVHQQPGRPSVLVGALAGEDGLVGSADGGRAWDRHEWPGPAASLALDADVLVTGGSAGAFASLATPVGLPVALGPVGERIDEVTLARAPAGTLDVFGLGERAVLRLRAAAPSGRLPGPPPPPRRVVPPRVELDPAVVARLGRPALLPARTTVDLRPGERRRVRYRLDLPPVPSPLDVYFVVDTTGSMGSTLAGLRRGIGRVVDDLAAAGIDARFGLADFQDYPFAPYGVPGDVVYRRNRRIGPADAELRAAIGGLTLGNGGDGPEAALAALYQSATGIGQRLVGRSGDPGVVVEPNQQAGFRPDALHVVVLATDAPFHEPGRSPGYPGPTWGQVAGALDRHAVKVAGLSIGLGQGGGHRDLVRAAATTGARAPGAGVDCDGDGDRDVRPGAPLVCPVADDSESINLAPAIVGMLRSLRDEAAVELLVEGDPEVARPAGRSAYGRVNVRERNRLEFDVDYACPAGRPDVDLPVTLRAVSRGASLAVARARVRCASPPVRRAPRVVVAAAPVVVAAAPPPPAPQQPPRLEQNLNPQGNSQPQAQSHLNGAAAAQEQEQPQLALAVADEAPATELAMSRQETRGPTELLLAALALSGAAAVAARSRAAPAVAVARARARRRP